MKDYIEGFLVIIGIGVTLHYYGYAVAWGAAKGWAKVTHQTQLVIKNNTENKDVPKT